MLITNITWETDGADVSLPQEVEVPDGLTNEQIADYLSNEYGFLVDSCAVPMTDEDIDNFGLYVNEVEGRVS